MILARRNERKVRSDWEHLLSPDSELVLTTAQGSVRDNAHLIGVTLSEATQIRKLGDLDEALRFLKIGTSVIEEFTPSLLALLGVMTKFSRMVSALAPVDPLVPADFHLAELTSLAHLHKLLHQMIVSTKQRFRLKLFIIAKGISMTSHYLLTQIRNIVSRKTEAEQEWEQVERIGCDFNRLAEESVRSFRTLLEALSSDAARQLGEELMLSRRQPKSLPR
jgi:hypothetical protein